MSDGSRSSPRRGSQWAIRGTIVGLGMFAAGAIAAQLAFLWSWTGMDNQPPDPPWIPMWNVALVIAGAGIALAAAGATCWAILAVELRLCHRE